MSEWTKHGPDFWQGYEQWLIKGENGMAVATCYDEADADEIIAAHNAPPAALVEALRESRSMLWRAYAIQGPHEPISPSKARQLVDRITAALNSAGTGEAT